MRETEFFTQANQHFTDLVAEITDEQWTRRVQSTPDWTVRQLVNHVAQNNLMLVNGFAEHPTDVPDNVLGEVPQTSWIETAQAAEAAVAGLTEPDQMVKGMRGEVPAGTALMAQASDRTIHSWDLAHAIGADETIESGLLQAVYDFMLPNAGSLEASGVFAAPVQVGADASLQEKFLAMTGRDPGYEHEEPNDDGERAEEIHRS